MRSRKQSDMAFLYRRLDEVRMGEYERIRAKAHLERAEAVADFVAAVGARASRLFRKLVVRPVRRVAASIG